jgi:transcriptional regulator with XRE-family HTH domain
MQYPRSGTGTPYSGDMGRNVGMRLRYARKLRGLSQVDLAKTAKVAQGTISDLETGASKAPVGTNLVSIAQSLNVSPEWLATGKGPMTATDTPSTLSAQAIAVARDWETLAPEVREKVADMIRELASAARSFGPAIEDEKVAAAYGKPGTKKVK